MNLRDQLKQARLLSDKDARRLAHESRVERKHKGREQLEQEQQRRQQELEQLRSAEREQNQQRQQAQQAARRQQAEAAAVDELLQRARKPASGAVKFYFETDDGALPWLELSPREARELESRQLCVVRVGAPRAHDYRLLDQEQARRVAACYPDAVVRGPGR